MKPKISMIGLGVRDFAASLAFYRDGLGFPVHNHQEGEDFAMFAVRERISPLGLAVIQHHYPCLDASSAWFVHPNSAKEVAGVAFAGAEPGPFAQAAAEALDLSGFEYWEQAAFSDAFGEGVDCAVRVRVSSLAAARASLSPSLAAMESKGRLHVTPPSPLGCGFLFFES